MGQTDRGQTINKQTTNMKRFKLDIKRMDSFFKGKNSDQVKDLVNNCIQTYMNYETEGTVRNKTVEILVDTKILVETEAE